jgi:hypothetical protein
MKTKIIMTISLIFLVLSLSSCDIADSLLGGGGTGDTSHSHTYGEWIKVKAPSCSERGREMRECRSCGDKEYRAIDKTSHTAVTDIGYSSTCTEKGLSCGSHCSVCNEVLQKQEELPLAQHKEEIIPATDKKTEGKRCSVCGTVLIRQEWIIANDYASVENYDGDYGYNYLGSMTKGEALQSFYLELDAAADKFHVGEDIAEREDKENGEYIVERLDYEKYGLTSEEAITVWSIYRLDRPLYYWIASNIKYTSRELYLIVFEEYADTVTRLAYNDEVYERVEEIFETAGAPDSPYALTLAINDEIVESSSYAYTGDGLTPSTSAEAHNILGILLSGSGVCESYAKSFQLLLNYAELENILVTGVGITTQGSEAHAWNMVRMDDNKWYYFDLTWNDQPSLMLGKQYNYFCISEGEGVRWSHGDSQRVYPTVTFSDTHIPDTSGVLGANFLYDLPDVSENPYENVEICKETFTKSGLKYVVCGYRELQLYEITVGGTVVIPSELTFNGTSYTVVSIGRLVDGIYEYDYISDREVTDVFVPSTVEHIWYGAFNISSLTEIRVDSNNPEYASDGGILYSKDFTQLEWVPQSISGELVIRPETRNYEDVTITYCPYVTAIKLPEGINLIAERAFAGCRSLREIYFDGTVSEWHLLPKGTDFNALNTQRITVHCTDGDVFL